MTDWMLKPCCNAKSLSSVCITILFTCTVYGNVGSKSHISERKPRLLGYWCESCYSQMTVHLLHTLLFDVYGLLYFSLVPVGFTGQFTSINCVFSICILFTVMCIWTCECFSSRSDVSSIPTIPSSISAGEYVWSWFDNPLFHYG